MPDRRRTVRWDAPAGSDTSLSGLDGLRAMLDGTRPRPAASVLIGLEARSVEHGRVRMALTPAEYLYNPFGGVHGGVIATVLDTVMACAVSSTLPAGRQCVSLEIKVNFLRAVTEATGTVVGEGVSVHTGRQVGVAEGRITDEAGRIYATASTTMLVWEPKPGERRVPGAAGARSFGWDDPAAVVAAGRARAGLDVLRAALHGDGPLPPVMPLLGMELAEVAAGRVAIALPPGGHTTNPAGTLHGGMMATLLDSAMGCAVQSTLSEGRGLTTLELKVSYLRAVTEAGGLVTAVGEVVHGGRQVAVADARATDAAGRLCATASTTCLVFDHRPH